MIEFSEKSDLRKRALEFIARINAIADEITGENAKTLTASIMGAVDKIRNHADADAPMTAQAGFAGYWTPPALKTDLESAVAGTRAYALLNAYESAAKFVPGIGSLSAGVELDPLYDKATQWMLDRALASVADVRAMADAIAALDPLAATPLELERAIRSQVLALEGAPGEELQRMFQDHISAAVNEGRTVGQFVEGFDAAVADGTLPAGMDSYLNLVYRTETSNAYGEQNREGYNDPMIADFGWGIGITNAQLPSSRPSHEALDGLLVQKGSPAMEQLDADGHYPYNYNCTCVEYTIVDPDGVNSLQYSEPDNALELVQNITRFGDAEPR